MANDERDDNIKKSTNYIIIFYAPVWIQIKKNISCTDRAKNVHFILKRLEKIEDNVIRAIGLHNLKMFC